MKHADKNVFSFIHAASSLFSSQDILSILKKEKISNPFPLSSVVLIFRNK
jgi:hypothetical protein